MFRLAPYQGSRVVRSNNDFDPFYRMMDDFFSDVPSSSFKTFKIDIQDNESNYTLEAELPGVAKEDILVDYKEDTLLIQVESLKEEEEKDKNYIRKERHWGKMKRAFKVKDIQADQISAKLENGILTIVAPKTVEVDTSFRVDIE